MKFLYPYKHSGNVIICAGGENLENDFELAQNQYPDSKILCVGSGAKNIKADFLYSISSPLLKIRREYQERLGHKFAVFSTKPPHISDIHLIGYNKKLDKKDCFWVDYWFPKTYVMAGGSATWSASKLAWQIGFDRVIYCGFDLEPEEKWRAQRVVILREYPILSKKINLISMSGWFKETFND